MLNLRTVYCCPVIFIDFFQNTKFAFKSIDLNMGSERNFRSHYYEKMGFRGVEEKKSLDILLREKPMDRDRIHNFCLR